MKAGYDFRRQVDINNLMYWVQYGGYEMGSKWCKKLGYVSLDFDCEDCSFQCKNKKES